MNFFERNVKKCPFLGKKTLISEKMNYKRDLIKLSDKLNDGKSAEEFQENA
jgi:hypothetical protein